MGSHARARWTLLAATTVLAIPAALATSDAAHAAVITRYVAQSNGDDSGPNPCTSPSAPCETVQQAVDEANPGDTIFVEAGSYPESVHVRQSVTFIGSGASITGNGSDDGLFVDGFDTDARPVVTVKNLAISGIEVAGADAALIDLASNNTTGAGLAVGTDGNVTASSSAFSNNEGDGVDLDSTGTLIMTNVAIDQNGGAGLRATQGTAMVKRSEITRNAKGGVVDGYGDSLSVASLDRVIVDGNEGAGVVALTGGTINVLRSAITESTPAPDNSYGGGVLAQGGTAHVAESLVDANTAFGVEVNHGKATIAASTISGTKPAADSTIAGAVASDQSTDTAGDVTVTGTILDANHVADCHGPHTDLGFNLISDRTCGPAAAGTKTHTSAQLGKAGFHTGYTVTRLPSRTSAALNAIPRGKAYCVKGATDQRGAKRPDHVTGRCDIGSVELSVVNPKIRAKLSSAGPHTRTVFYAPVKVSFSCKKGTGPLVHRCPRPVRVHTLGKHRVVGSIRATDGGRARVVLRFTIRPAKG